MTFEEARKVFLNRGYEQVDGGSIYNPDKWRESIIVISDWLQREPCEDCISRQMVLEIAKLSKSNWIDNSVLFKRVNELPTVQPKQRVGRWIFKHNSSDIWCSCCDENYDEIPQKFIYCPNCGARMEGEK